jgi:regulatory protein
MNLLKSREYTTEELCRKLKQGFYPESVIEQALEYVAAFGYVDDLRYAVSYLQSYEGSKSIRRMQQDLQKKGISSSVWESAYAKWQTEGGTQDESEMIDKLLQKRHYHSETADFKEKQKTFHF